MAFQQKRRTQTTEYWVDEFAVHKEDVDTSTSGWWRERAAHARSAGHQAHGAPLPARRAGPGQERPGSGLPAAEKFEVGQKIVFPVLDYASDRCWPCGRQQHPLRPFQRNPGATGERGKPARVRADSPWTIPCRKVWRRWSRARPPRPPQLYERYGEHVRTRLLEALQRNEEFVQLDDRWFLRGLLPKVTPFPHEHRRSDD